MLEAFLIVIISVILTLTIFAFIFGMFTVVFSYHEYGIKAAASITLVSFLLVIVNFNYVGVENQNKFVKTYTKEEVTKMMKSVSDNKRYLAGDNTLFRIDDLNYYKLLCDSYELNVYEDNKIIKLYFYKHIKKRGLFSEVSCTEQNILKE